MPAFRCSLVCAGAADAIIGSWNRVQEIRLIHLIGGEKGGVGKSVVARLLCQYLVDNSRTFHGFDADRSHPALQRYYAEFSTGVDLQDYESCDAIVAQSAESGADAIVDLPAQSERHLSRWLGDSGIAELCNDLGLRLVRWQVMDDGKDAFQLLEGLVESATPDTDYVVVQNLGCSTSFDWINDSDVMQRVRAIGASVIQLPALHKPTMNKIDRIDASFWAATHNTDSDVGPTLNLVERQRVKMWLRRAYAQLALAHPSLAPTAVQQQQFQTQE